MTPSLVTAAARAEKAWRKDLAQRLMSLPPNPEITPLPGGKAFAICFSRLRDVWAPSYYQFESQYEKLAYAAKRMSPLAFWKLLRSIRESGQAIMHDVEPAALAMIRQTNSRSRNPRAIGPRRVGMADGSHTYESHGAKTKVRFHPAAFLNVAASVGLVVVGNDKTQWGRSLKHEINHRRSGEAAAVAVGRQRTEV